MIRYRDGSVLARWGQPDMRTPIAYCLAWPERVDAGVEPLNLVTAGRLDFEAPDLDAFPWPGWLSRPLRVRRHVRFQRPNEIAVAAFLAGDVRFTDIDRVIESTLADVNLSEPQSLDAVQALDQVAREVASSRVAALSSRSVTQG